MKNTKRFTKRSTKARMTRSAQTTDTFKVKASDVFDKIDERFNKQAEHSEAVRNEMRSEIRALGEKIDAQIHTFDKQLSKLNDNMESVLQTIHNHEQRLTKLETDRQIKETRKETARDLFQTIKSVGVSIIWALAIIGAACGVKPFAKLLGLLN